MGRIEHVVVLMLENRSFDSMLGRLYPGRADFDGLTGGEDNPLHAPDGSSQTVPVWNSPDITPESACIPDPDPGELFDDITMQVFGLYGSPANSPNMSGFVDNYMRQPGNQPHDPRAVMHCFTPEQVPVISELARCFAVCDCWFSSAPCQTWPNRLFAHAGTAGGRLNNHTIPRPFFLPTIFRHLERHKRSWRVYFHDIPQTAALFDLWTRIPTHFRLFDPEFLADAQDGSLPHYSFVEPRYFAGLVSGLPPNDQHPPHNVVYGEQLIATMYNVLRSGPAWERTLLVLIYDEHGGCYDHVPPPSATPLDPPYPAEFRFDRYGPRIPAVIASPWIPAGTVMRPPDGSPPFDHTSILATLHRLFDLGPEPTTRVAAAPDLLRVLSLPRPDNLGPLRLDVSDTTADRRELRGLRARAWNGHQRRLRDPLALIPGTLARAAGHFHGANRNRRTKRQ